MDLRIEDSTNHSRYISPTKKHESLQIILDKDEVTLE